MTSPKNNFFLIGQEEAEQVILDAYYGNKLHNSWLISGVKGIGKATLAYRFARFLLEESNKSRPDLKLNFPDQVEGDPEKQFRVRSGETLATDPNSQTNRLIDGNAHPDLKIVERDFIETDKKKVIKAIKDGDAMDDEELKSLKKSAFIRVDDVRAINEFMSKTSSNGGWKVAIIDSIDDMNTAGANALLKILEEPPAKSILLLVSHNTGGLLPTIKSRCNKLVLKPLDNNVVSSLLRRYRPDLAESEIKSLAAIAGGSVGKAIDYADMDAVRMYDELKDLIYSGNKLSKMLNFVDDTVSSEERYALATELILRFCSDNIAGSKDKEGVFQVWENAVKTFRQTESLNMDKKQVLINIINSLCKVI